MTAPTIHERARRPSTQQNGQEKAKRHVPRRTLNVRHSAKNILEWNSYLPADCVRTMVKMGWDYTT